MPTKHDYDRVLNKAWEGVPISDRFSVDPKDAIAFCKAYWKQHLKKPFPYKVQIVGGNRQTWVRNGTLFINPKDGWGEINHAWSHWVSYRQGNRKPHCDKHLELERSGRLLIKGKFIKATQPNVFWLREYHPNGAKTPTYVAVKNPKPGDIKCVRV